MAFWFATDSRSWKASLKPHRSQQTEEKTSQLSSRPVITHRHSSHDECNCRCIGHGETTYFCALRCCRIGGRPRASFFVLGAADIDRQEEARNALQGGVNRPKTVKTCIARGGALRCFSGCYASCPRELRGASLALSTDSVGGDFVDLESDFTAL